MMNRDGFSSTETFIYAIGAGIAWTAAFVGCAVWLTGLITASTGTNLDQVFSLQGSGVALAAKYLVLLVVAGMLVASVATAFVTAGNLSRGDFEADSPDSSWIDAAPAWLRSWETRVARPVRTFMGRSRSAG